MKSAGYVCRTLGAVALALLLLPSAGLAACGDGTLDPNEECDGGGALYIDGDPANGECQSGSRCYFEFSCCKFNCQYVGTPGLPCNDNDSCSGPDTCTQVGTCQGGPNVADGTPCDDGLFCTGTESCQNGTCTASTGDPCPGNACNLCQEDTDSCFDPAGAPCSDGSVCVTGGTCDGAGTCNGGVFNAGPCDDGIYCNGTDTCSGGACSIHTGDPCSGPDGDGNCTESCNEATDTCNASDVDGSYCDDQLYCNGEADACDAGACVGTGTAACDDGEDCTADSCDEGSDSCMHTGDADGVPCNDGDACSLDDVCSGSVCAGDPPQTADLCPWTVVLAENPKKDQIKSSFQVSLAGDVCGGTIKLYDHTNVLSDLVSDEAAGTGQLRFPSNVVVGGDIVSAGGGARALPGSGTLPYTAPHESSLPPLSLYPKEDNTGFYDLTGTHPLVTECHAARVSLPATAGTVLGLPATAAQGDIVLPSAGSHTITATAVGGLNVIDVGGNVQLGNDAELILDGAGNPDTVMIVRISGKLQMRLRSAITLAGDLTPSNTLIFVSSKKCQFGDLSIGAGTVLCSPGRIKTGRSVAWVGALYGDGKKLNLGQKTSVFYTPFVGLP